MAMNFSLEGVALPDVLQMISMSRLTGVGTLARDQESIRLVFRQGRLVHAVASRGGRLGESLIAREIVTEKQVKDALAEQRSQHYHEHLATILERMTDVPVEVIECETVDHIKHVFGELVTWEYGNFSFRPADLDARVTVLREGLKVEHLLLQAAANADETQYEELDDELQEELLEFLP